MTETTFIELDRAYVKKGGLRKFIEISWHQVEPGKSFISGWHIDAICEHLEAISRGQLTRLVQYTARLYEEPHSLAGE